MLGFFRENAVDQVYAYEMLQKFASSLIGVFIPVYIASQGSPLQWIFLYLMGYSAVFMMGAIPVSYVIARIGFKHSLVASFFFYLPAFMLLRSYSLSASLVAAVALLMGVGKALHWIALHAEFAVDSQSDSRGKASSRLLGLPRLSRAAAPFIGGVIMAVYSFHALVTTTILFYVLSAVPLFASGDHRDPMAYSFRDFLDRKHVKLATLFFFRGVAISAAGFLFPLYVFYVIGGTVNVGGVSSLGSVGSVAFALFIGRITQKVERRHMIIIGSISSAVMFLLRSYVNVQMEAFLVSFASGLLFMVYYIPLYSSLADMAEDEDVLEFYGFREVCLGVGKIAGFGTALLIGLAYTPVVGFKASFYLAAVSVALLTFYARWIS